MIGFFLKIIIFIAIISNLDKISLAKILNGLVIAFSYGAYIINQIIEYLHI